MTGDVFLPSLWQALGAFHFLRPWILVLLLGVIWLWWRVRSRAMRRADVAPGIAPHLHEALTVGETGRRRVLPIDGVALALVCVVLAAAGPTWSRMSDPFTAPTAPVVVILKVTPSMARDDLAPSRLARATFKIRDLLDLRAGGRTALVAYAGTAHRVVPFTEDAGIMLPYLEGLSPEVMPQEGADILAGLALAEALLDGEGGPGGILFVVDEVDPSVVSQITSDSQHALVFLQMLPQGTRDRGLDAVATGTVIAQTPDGSDLARVDRVLNAAYRAALLETSTQPWQDRGWILAVPAAVLCLIWFRRGWTMRWAILFVAACLAVPPGAARADGIASWFLTPDQQGQRAFNQRDFARAAELFEDPMWRGYALYRSGQYDVATEVLATVATAEAAHVQGMAHIKNRQYREGVRAFELVLSRDPDYPGASENLETAREIVEFVEELRSQSDTGEDSGIGADDTVLDNEENLGSETEMQAPVEAGAEMLTTEQWMNTVDTRTGDFLRQRFLFEATRRPDK